MIRTTGRVESHSKSAIAGVGYWSGPDAHHQTAIAGDGPGALGNRLPPALSQNLLILSRTLLGSSFAGLSGALALFEAHPAQSFPPTLTALIPSPLSQPPHTHALRILT